MRRTVARSVFAGLLLLGIPFGMAIAGPDAPGVIYMKAGPRTTPVWISAEEAATPAKDGLRWQLFSESDQGNLRRFLAESERLKGERKSRGARESESDCPIFLSTPDEGRIDPKPNRSFADLTKQALAIYSGRIEGISKGFFDGLPSSLLRVKVTEAFRSSDLVAKEEVLIPYPFARFKAGASTYCGGSAEMYQPAIGDQVLVFLYDPPLDAARTLVYPRSPELFFQDSAGRLVVPGPLKMDRDIAVAGSLEGLAFKLPICSRRSGSISAVTEPPNVSHGPAVGQRKDFSGSISTGTATSTAAASCSARALSSHRVNPRPTVSKR